MIKKKKLAEFIDYMTDLKVSTNHSEDRALMDKYISEAGSLLASLELNNKISLEELNRFERLLSQTWMKDRDGYESLYNLWSGFKSEGL